MYRPKTATRDSYDGQKPTAVIPGRRVWKGLNTVSNVFFTVHFSVPREIMLERGHLRMPSLSLELLLFRLQ